MRGPIALFALLVACAPGLAQTVATIEALKDPCLQTPLVRDGQPSAVIVPGEAPELADIARRVQADVRQALGVELPILAPEAVTDEVRQRMHCIAIGDCNSNALIGRLYAMRLCFVDGVYPGKGQVNPGFDLDSDGDGTPDLWSFSTPTGDTHRLQLDSELSRSAPCSVRIDGDTAEGGARACAMRNLDLTPGRSYTMKLWYRAALAQGSSGTFHVDFYTRPSGGERLEISSKSLADTAGEWVEAENHFTVPEGTGVTRVLLYLHGKGSIWYDDVSLRQEGSERDLLSVGNTGAVARTVHNPWGHKNNVVVLGASEPAAFELSYELLKPYLSAPVLPDLMQIRLGDSVRLQGVVPAVGPTDEAIAQNARAARERLDSNAFVPVRDVMQGTKSTAINWYLTGDPQWARLYAAIWREILDTAASNAYGPMEWTFNTMDGWDLMDECPELSDELKLEITRRLLLIGVKNETSYGPNIARVDRPLADGHQLDQGLCVYMHGLYFSKYYGINAHWMEMAEPLIRLGAQAPRVHDSYAYGPIIGNDFMSEYALKSGDMEYFANDNCRKQVEWQALCSDNIGGGGTFGDDGAWRGSVPVALFYKANWYYGDDTMKWLLQGRRPPVGYFANDRPAEKPEQLLGVAFIPLHERLYQVAAATKRDAGAASWSPELVPLEKAFDKLSFRSDFGENEQYLLLEGLGAVPHGHLDGNSILRFTDNGRLFLTEGHYVETTTRRHNTLLVARDGESWCPPPLCSLEQKASLPRTGLVQTQTGAYNGVDWRRSILWSKERFFVFVDQLTAREEGDFAFELLWRTLGDASLDQSGTFTTDQMGQSMAITRTDGSRCLIRELLDYHGANYYGSYPYCRDGLVKVLRQAAAPHLAAGQSYTYLNAVQTFETGKEPLPVRRLSDSAMLLGGAGGRVCVGVGEGGFAGAPRTDAPLWMVDEAGVVSLAGGTEFAWGELTLTWGGGAVEVDLKTGEAMGETGPVQVSIAGDRDLKPLLEAASGVASPPPVVPPATRTPEPEARRLWAVELPPSARLVTSEAGTRVDCNPAPLPASTWQQDYKIDPQRLCYSWDAIVLWKEDEQAQITINLPQARDISRIAVRTMWTNNSKLGIQYRLGRLSIAAAKTRNGAFETIQTFEETEKHAVPSYPEYSVDTPGLQAQAIRITAEPQEGCALFFQGIRAWGAPEPAREARADYERWEPGSVSALCAAKLGQTGADCAVYGCRDGKVTVIEQSKELWTVETGARVNSLAAADLTADGRPELLVGTNDQRLLCLDAAGEELWQREFPDFWGRRGNVMWVGAGDVDGDGDNEVVLSCENWHYYCLDHEGKTIWSHEIQHSGLKGALGDVNGDGRLETLCGEQYYGWPVLDSSGKPLFSVGGSGPVTTAALAEDITGDGVADVVFGNQTFGVYARDGKGAVLLNTSVPGFVNDLATLSTDGAPRLIAAVDGLSRNLIAFGGDGQRAWQVTLPGAPLALATLPGAVAAGCQDGALRLIAPDGRVLRAETLQGPVTHVVAGDFDGDGEVEVCGVGDRELVAVD